MEGIIILLAFFLGVITQRIFSAREVLTMKLGESWNWSENRLYKLVHRIYCELCPKRGYCERYWWEIGKKPKLKLKNARDIAQS